MVGASLSRATTSVRRPCVAGFSEPVVDDDEAGQRVGPPPAGSGIQDQAGEDGGGEESVDEGHPAFGLQHRVAEGSAGSGLAGGQGEHDRGGDGGPGDAEGAVVGAEPAGEDDR